MPIKTISFLDIFKNQGGFLRFMGPRILMDPNPGAGGGAGGAGGAGGTGGAGDADKDKAIADLKAEIEKLKATSTPPPKKDDDDLQAKAKKEKEISDKALNDTKKLEGSLKFNLTVNDFVKNNKDILPSDIDGILKAAEKENYDTASNKANALKVGMIGSFFSVQSNIDFLTQAQKIQLEDFLKLTKNGKEERAEHVFENIFEPAIEMLKKVKKAEEVGKARAGFASSSTVEEAYKERLIKMSKRSHLNEKGE